MRAIVKFLFWIFGWKVIGEFPEGKKRYVAVVGPHTSAWDVFFGLGAKVIYDVDIHFLGKEEAFKFPIGGLLRYFGGIPVDRFSNNNVVEQVIKLFQENDEFIFALSPEGTREKVDEFRKGFYYMALGADVPILVCFLDYVKKEVGIGLIVKPSGNYQEDVEKIKTFYKEVSAKYPEKGIY